MFVIATGTDQDLARNVPRVTPGSPVGRAMVGAAVGSTVTYEPRRGVTVEVRILEASARLAKSA